MVGEWPAVSRRVHRAPLLAPRGSSLPAACTVNTGLLHHLGAKLRRSQRVEWGEGPTNLFKRATFDKHFTPRCSNEQAALDMLPFPSREHFLNQS